MIFWLESRDQLLLELDILQSSPHPPDYIVFYGVWTILTKTFLLLPVEEIVSSHIKGNLACVCNMYWLQYFCCRCYPGLL